MMSPEPEGDSRSNRTAQTPARPALVVARERGQRLAPQLSLVLAIANPARRPAGVQQIEHLLQLLAPSEWSRFERLVYDDPERWWMGLLGGYAQDARDL